MPSHLSRLVASSVLLLACQPTTGETIAQLDDDQQSAGADNDDGKAGANANSSTADDDSTDTSRDDDDTSAADDSESDDDDTSAADDSEVTDDDSESDDDAASGGQGGAGADDDGAEGGAPAFADDDATPPEPTGEACPSYAIFCDSFEDGDGVDTERWDIWDYWAELAGQKEREAQSSQFQIDTSTSVHGSRSLHLLWGGEFGAQVPNTIQNKVGFAAPDDELYARLYMRFASLEIPGAHPYFLTALGPEDQWEPYGAQVAFGSIWNGFATNAFSRGIDYGLPWLAAADTIAANEWFCVQIHAFGDHQGAGDTEHPDEVFAVSINSMAVPELVGTDAAWPAEGQPEYWSPTYDGSFWRLGFGSAPSNEEGMEYWVDALAFAHQPIPCLE